jgi:hypothetical protein
MGVGAHHPFGDQTKQAHLLLKQETGNKEKPIFLEASRLFVL